MSNQTIVPFSELKIVFGPKPTTEAAGRPHPRPVVHALHHAVRALEPTSYERAHALLANTSGVLSPVALQKRLADVGIQAPLASLQWLAHREGLHGRGFDQNTLVGLFHRGVIVPPSDKHPRGAIALWRDAPRWIPTRDHALLLNDPARLLPSGNARENWKYLMEAFGHRPDKDHPGSWMPLRTMQLFMRHGIVQASPNALEVSTFDARKVGLAIASDPKMLDHAIAQLIRAGDEDGDGLLNRDELIRALNLGSEDNRRARATASQIIAMVRGPDDKIVSAEDLRKALAASPDKLSANPHRLTSALSIQLEITAAGIVPRYSIDVSRFPIQRQVDWIRRASKQSSDEMTITIAELRTAFNRNRKLFQDKGSTWKKIRDSLGAAGEGLFGKDDHKLNKLVKIYGNSDQTTGKPEDMFTSQLAHAIDVGAIRFDQYANLNLHDV